MTAKTNPKPFNASDGLLASEVTTLWRYTNMLIIIIIIITIIKCQ